MIKTHLSKLIATSRLWLENFYRHQTSENLRNSSSMDGEKVWLTSLKRQENRKTSMTAMVRVGEAFNKKGIEDGRIGVNPSSTREMAAKIAEKWRFMIWNLFSQKLSSTQVKLESISRHKDTRNKQLDWLLGIKKVMDKHYETHSKKYNFLLGIIFLMASILLVLADFPITSQVAINGFKLSGNSVPFIDIAKIDDLDSFAFALGLVIMTFYFKVIYDEYFGDSLGKAIAKHLEKESDNAPRIISVKLIVNCSILITLIATLITIGLFRYNYALSEINKEKEKNIEMIRTLTESGLHDEAQKLARTNQFISNTMDTGTAKWSFILTGLIFPIIGGVFASLGISYLWNVWRRFLINRKLSLAHFKLRRTTEKLENIVGKITAYESHVHWSKPDSTFTQEYTDYFFNCYLSGFDKGVHKNVSEDLFEYANILRKRRLGTEEFNTLNS